MKQLRALGMLKLRDYQEESHIQMINNFKKHKKVLLCIMAGGGKSITAGSFIAKYQKHYKFVLIVRKRDLVEQLADDALDTFGLDYSIFMAGHKKYDPSKSIQVCSKDTMQSRNTLPFLGEENVIVMVDECDEFPDYQKEIIERYESALIGSKRFFYFGMTATPFNGLDHFDVCIQPITPKELLKAGVLVDFEYTIPELIDYSDVGVVDGKFSTKDILRKMDHPKQIAASFQAWQEHGDDRQTLIFTINKAHSKRVVEYINNYYGKEVAIHCDADTPKEERKDAINKFKNGAIKFLSNIRLFTRGTNIVEIGTIWDDAPTLSLNLHIQKIGRGSRKNPIYRDCKLIDNANNLMNLGHFYQERKIDLKTPSKLKKKELEVSQMRRCEKCFRAEEPQAFVNNTCPFCGHRVKAIKKKKVSKYMKQKIFMKNATPEQIEQKQMINEFKKILWKKQNLGKRYPKDIARILAQKDLIKKHGLSKVLKIRNSIGLTDKTIADYKRNQYVPLGGLDL